MLTRLKVRGFKSLEDIEVRFGPLTCIAGVNGVGKSNLFDAILFLKHLADHPLLEAAAKIRNGGKRRVNIASLFTRTATHQAQLMEFEADFLVGPTVTDDFGREARPTVTYLTYKVALTLAAASVNAPERLELVSESLTFIDKDRAAEALGFPASTEFVDSVYRGDGKSDFIYMNAGQPAVVQLPQDQSAGVPTSISIARAGRTVLSSINGIDRPTVLAARREMQSWQNLQLEVSALRQPDDLDAPSSVSSTGAHLPATLDRLKKNEAVAGQLANLLPDVATVLVDVDDKRELKTLFIKTLSGIEHEARVLSDGTLRFLALAIISLDANADGVICLEEPENGIHPGRIPVIVDLLKAMAVDTDAAVGPDNPLRQIIVNTHAPQLIQLLSMDEIVVVESCKRDGASLSLFSAVENTWRTDAAMERKADAVAPGALWVYLAENDVVEKDNSGKLTARESYRGQLDALGY